MDNVVEYGRSSCNSPDFGSERQAMTNIGRTQTSIRGTPWDLQKNSRRPGLIESFSAVVKSEDVEDAVKESSASWLLDLGRKKHP